MDHPRHLLAARQILRDRQRVLAVLAHAQRHAFQPLDEQERVERRHRRAEVAQQHHAHAQDIGDRPERLGGLRPHRAVVAGIGRVQQRLAFLVLIPREVAAVDHHAADRGAVAADVFRGRIHHHGRAMVERPHQRRRGGVVHDQRNAELAGRSPRPRRWGTRSASGSAASRRSRRGCGHRWRARTPRVGRIDEAGLDALVLQRVGEQVPGAAVQVGGTDDVVAGARQVLHRERRGSLAGRERRAPPRHPRPPRCASRTHPASGS